jgi:uncharacterized protein HemX
VSDGGLKRAAVRRGWAVLAVLAIGVGGVAWSGCGSDSDSTKSIEQRIEKGVEEAEKGVKKGLNEAKKGLGDEARKKVNEAQKEAEKGIEKGKEEAKKSIEEAEKYYSP